MMRQCETTLRLAEEELRLLDNFTWGNPEKPERLGSLVRACEACYDFSVAFKTPFISGKDSLYNESPMGPVTPTLLITAVGIIPNIQSHLDGLESTWQPALPYRRNIQRTGRLRILQTQRLPGRKRSQSERRESQTYIQSRNKSHRLRLSQSAMTSQKAAWRWRRRRWRLQAAWAWRWI